jgi:hypothetical protein
MIVERGSIGSWSFGDKLWNRFRLGLSRTKTEYMRCDFSTTRHEEEVSLDGQVVPHKDTIRYLGSMLTSMMM